MPSTRLAFTSSLLVTVELTVTAPESASVIWPTPALLPMVYAPAVPENSSVISEMLPVEIIALLEVPLKVAVSAAPGTVDGLQFKEEDQVALLAPDHE